MNKEKVFKGIYGYFEVLLNIGSSLLILFATEIFITQYVPFFAEDDIVSSPPVLYIAQSFGLVLFTLGAVQFGVIHKGLYQVRKWFIQFLLLGDILHLWVSISYFKEFGIWDFGAYFNFSVTILLLLSRCCFLYWIGIPANSKHEK